MSPAGVARESRNQCKGLELDLLQLRRLNCLQRSILVQKRGPEEKGKGGSSRCVQIQVNGVQEQINGAQPRPCIGNLGCACHSA